VAGTEDGALQIIANPACYWCVCMFYC